MLPSPPGTATHPLGSIGAPARRWVTMRSETTWSAPASASTPGRSPVSSSGPGMAKGKHTLDGCPSHTTGESGSAARSKSETTGSGLYSTYTASAASFACAWVSATTAATMSPTKRTRPAAKGGRLKSGGIIGKPWKASIGRFSAVYTATTPGMDEASEVSMEAISAWASGDRTKATRAASTSRSST